MSWHIWIDQQVLQGLSDYRPQWLVDLVRAISDVGESTVTIGLAGLAAIGWSIHQRVWRPLVATLAAYLIANTLGNLLKEVFNRPRPPAVYQLEGIHGSSFPSTHAMRLSAASVALYLVLQQRRKWLGDLLYAANIVIGICMMYLAVHWLTDVLAGWALGCPIGAIIGKALHPRQQAPPQAL